MYEAENFWTVRIEQIFNKLETSSNGLKSKDAISRLEIYGQNVLNNTQKTKTLHLFLSQFKNSVIFLLIFATILSLFLGNFNDATIVFIIIFISTILGFLQKNRTILNQFYKKFKS